MSSTQHVIAILGGAVSGAEAAATLADKGIEVVVFEQNKRPYGKIEDGLPRWHDKQRRNEYARIDTKLCTPGVHFVPSTKLGDNLDFEELVSDWGFSAVLLATGAWRDRSLGVEGLDDYVGRGLVYQNPFVYWFNHYEEAGYDGERYACPDDAMVIGGGLASFDVVKILMLETVGRKLRERGTPVDMLTMEHKGVAAVLEELGLTLGHLGLQGCTLYYRRRALDMPIAEYKPGATPEQMQKTEGVRERILENAMRKYLFRFQPTHLPVGGIIEDGRLAGLRFVRTEIRDRKVISLEGTEVEYRAPLIISSIGSVPERIPGVPNNGEFYDFNWEGTPQLKGYPTVFGLGNVVTGKGNIAVSRRHGAQVATEIYEQYLGVRMRAETEASMYASTEGRAHEQAEKIAERVARFAPLSEDRVKALRQRIRHAQEAVGYHGDYRMWMQKVTPQDLG